MKKIILTLSIFFSGILCLQAQNAQNAQGGSQEQQTQKWVSKLTEVCQLTPDQVTKVTPMVKQFVATRADNNQKYSNDVVARRAANKQNRENLNAQLKPILSEDQQVKAKEYIEEQKKERKTTNAASGGSTGGE